MSVADRLARWETAGGTWHVEPASGGRVTVVLSRCDGGEEVERLTCEAEELPGQSSARPPRSVSRRTGVDDVGRPDRHESRRTPGWGQPS